MLGEILRHEQDEIAPGELLGHIEAAGAPQAVQPAAAGAAPARRPEPVAASDPAPARGTAALSPAVRRLLAERGLDASDVAGSGPGGRITVEDVLRADPAGTAAAAPAAAAVAAPPEGVRRVPHTAVRKRIAEHMVQSLLHTAPHVTTVFEADLTAVLRDRAQRREEFAGRGAPLTLTRLLRAGDSRRDPRRARGQQPLDRHRARDLRGHAHRHRHGGGGHRARGAGAARCAGARPVRDRARPGGSGEPRPRAAG